MPPVAVVSDTTHYLPDEVVEANGIRVVSLYVTFEGERTQSEGSVRDFDAFYDELCTSDRLPTTSQPSVGDFVSVYEPLLAEGRDVVSIHLSAGLSGTYESARQAAAALEREGKDGGRVHVINSSTACGGSGLMVLGAARCALKGADVDKVIQHAHETRENLKMWFAVDSLEFLKRGGRIGGVSAWVGSTLKIKPILTVESELSPVERTRVRAARRLRAPAARLGRRRLGRPAHPVARPGGAPDRALPRDLRPGAGVRLGGRARDRRAHRPGAARSGLGARALPDLGAAAGAPGRG